MPGTGGSSLMETHAQMRTMADTPLFGRGQSQRLLTGFLEHILDNRASKRFAVLEQDLDSDNVYLKLYRDRTEAVLRKTYLLTKDNFVGTERGSVKRHSKYPVLYWAIILTTETVLFQDARHSSSEFERWNDLMKELWRHQSWMVKPVYGVSQSNEKEFVLHLNKVSLGLAHVNPPRHFLRWDIGDVQEANSSGKSFMFTVVSDSSSGNSGYYEVKTEKERQSSRIQEAYVMLTYVFPEIGELTSLKEGDRYVGEQPSTPNGPTQLPSPSTSTTSSIDPTTGEDIHMNVQDLKGKKPPQTPPVKVPTHLPLKESSKKNPTPPSPSSSQGSPVTNKPRKRFLGPKIITGRQKQMPEVPPRTTSCVIGETSPPVTKTYSMSTGNLRDPSPTLFNNRLSTASGYSSGNNSPDVPISAKQLPLPNPPVPSFPGRNSPLLHHPKPPSIDENSVYAGSNSSVASQSPTPSVSPMSLSDEESRHPSTNGHQGSPKEHTRCSSDVGINYFSRANYQRSVSMPTETDISSKPPSLAGHILTNTPHYINIREGSPDPVYINVSKKEDVYENPPMYHEEYEPQNPLPLPPRIPKPPMRQAKLGKTQSLQEQRPTEVSDILNEIMRSDRQVKGSDLGMTYGTFKKLCFSMDVEHIGPEPNNWKGLAMHIGIEKIQDIVMIDAFSRRHSQSPTDIVLYYWHCQINPPRMHCMEELKAILAELDRDDILEIVSQQTGI